MIYSVRQAALLVLSLLAIATGSGAQNSFVEDFTATTYKDLDNTTALWDTATGELRPHPFVSSLLGSYNPSGDVRGVAVDGDLAYVAAGNAGLHVFDISDPTAPVLLDTYNTPGYAYEVTFKERFIFVADWEAGVIIIDAFNPSNLVLMNDYNTSGSVLDIDLAGNRLFLGDGSHGLTILDITDPYDPFFLGSYDTTGDAARGLHAVGNFVYLVDGDAGLQIIDVSDSTQPALAATFDTPGYAYDVVVSGDYAFVSDQNNGLVVVNINDPDNPFEAGSLGINSQVRGITVKGNAVFLSADTAGMLVIDISNPSQPVLQETFDTAGVSYDIIVSGNLAYVADFGPGLKVIEIADNEVLNLTGSLDTTALDHDVCVKGNLAYLATSVGVQIVDITDPLTPEVLGNLVGAAYDVQVVGNYAYISGGNSGLKIADVSNPSLPVVVGSYSAGNFISGCVIEGTLAYCKSGSTMRVIDVSNPVDPTEIGSVGFGGTSVRDISIRGRFAYVSNMNLGLRIVDIADPTFPIIAMTHATQYTAHNVEIAGDFAYVGCDHALEIVDISDPLAPILVAVENRSGETFNDVVVAGNFAYVVTDSIFTRYFITDPTSPAFNIEGHHITGEAYSSLQVDGDYAYFTSSMYGSFATTGLEIVQISQRSVPQDGKEVWGASTAFDGADHTNVRGRASTQGQWNGSFYLSTSAGIYTQVPIDSWERLYPGPEMIWVGSLVWATDVPRPILSQVTVEWLTDFAPVRSLIDAPGDQGGWARLSLDRSGYDFADETESPVSGYQVYRRVDDPILSNETAKNTNPVEFPTPYARGLRRWTVGGHSYAEASNKSASNESVNIQSGSFPNGIWEAVAWIAATQADDYTLAVPTVADSTASGDHWSVFLVTTHTTTPSQWFSSSPDSVQSIDNIAPGVPQNLLASYSEDEIQLDWDDAEDVDFAFHRVYRDNDPDFIPAEENLIAETVGSIWLDAIAAPHNYHYKVSTLDFAGNESGTAALDQASDTSQGGPRPVLAIQAVAPNPFNPSTTIRYSLPQSGTVHLAIYDLAGRQVKRLVAEHQEAGEYTVPWRGVDATGRTVAAGVYVCYLQAQGKKDSQMLVLVK